MPEAVSQAHPLSTQRVVVLIRSFRMHCLCARGMCSFCLLLCHCISAPVASHL